MGFKVIKDGQELLIRDTPENRQKARDQGLTAYDELVSPDGKIVHVNENISAKAVREKGYQTPEGYQSVQKAYKEALTSREVSPLETAARATLNNMTWGAGPAIAGATRAIQRGALMSPNPLERIASEAKAEGLLEQQAQYQNPLTYLGTSLASGIAMPGAAVSKAKGILPSIGKASLIGAAESATATGLSQLSEPMEKTPEERLKEIGQAGLLGAGLGAVGGTIAKAPEIRAKVGETLADTARRIGVTKKGTKGLEDLISQNEKVSETLAPENLSAMDMAKIAQEEEVVAKPKGPIGAAIDFLLPEKFSRYLNNLEAFSQKKAGVSRAKQQLADIQKVIKEDKKLFLSEIQDELERKLFNGRNLDDLSTEEITNLDPNLVINVQNQLQKIENDINQFSNQDYVTARLRMPTKETTPLQKFVAEMSVGGEGGYGESVKTYENALKLGPERRAEAQGLDFDQAGESLWPTYKKAEESLSSGISDTMDVLTEEAKNAYRFLDVRLEDVDPQLRNEIQAFNEAIDQRKTALEGMKSPARYQEAKAVQQEISDLETKRLTLLNKAKKQVTARSEEFIKAGQEWFNKISNIRDDLKALQEKRGSKALSPAEKAINEGLAYVESGGGPSTYGFSNKHYTDPNLDDAERFSRLWKMRQILDDTIDYAKKEKKGSISEDDRFLMKARSILKDELRKYSTSFENSDRLYTMYSEIKKKIFGHAKKPLDRFDVSDMLKDTKQAKRYAVYLNQLRQLAVDPLISQEKRNEIQAFIDNFDKLKLLAKDKAAVANWEKVFGPTGQGTQKLAADAKRLASAVGESSSVGTLFGDPTNFLKIDQNFAPKISAITGKPSLKSLETDELLAITRANNKYQNALKNKETITDERLKTFYDEELAKIRSKSTPPEPPKGGGPSGGGGLPPSSGGTSNLQGSVTSKVAEGIKNYAMNKLIVNAANETAKALGSEQGINVFEPYKEDLKNYLVEEYGIPESVAKIAVKVLPSNPMELVGMMPHGMMNEMGNTIKFPSKNRFAKFYEERGYGPTKGEISDWIDEIKYEKKQKVQKNIGELLDSINDPEDIESLVHLGKLIDENDLPTPNTDKYEKKQKILKDKLNSLEEKQNESEHFQLDYDGFVDQFGKSPRNNEIVEFDEDKYKVSYHGDSAYLSPIDYDANQSEISRLKTQINMEKYKNELSNSDLKKSQQELGELVRNLSFDKKNKESLPYGIKLHFAKEFQKPKSTRELNDEIATQLNKELNQIKASQEWPYREYPKTKQIEGDIGEVKSTRLKLLLGGEPIDWETYARQIEQGTAKQGVFEQFNMSNPTPEQKTEYEKFSLFREQAKVIDKLEKLQELKNELAKGGKFERIKNRQSVKKKIQTLEQFYKSRISGKYRFDKWNYNTNSTDLKEPSSNNITKNNENKKIELTKEQSKGTQRIYNSDPYKMPLDHIPLTKKEWDDEIAFRKDLPKSTLLGILKVEDINYAKDYIDEMNSLLSKNPKNRKQLEDELAKKYLYEPFYLKPK